MGASESKFGGRFTTLITGTAFSSYQKSIIVNRSVNLIIETERDHRRSMVAYYTLVSIVVVVGILISSMIILNEMVVDSQVLFWIVWGLSIAVALANKLLFAFNVTKKYILNGIVLGKLYSEAWTFLAGSGRYGKHMDLDKRFEVFCDRIEKIKLKSIESATDLELGDYTSGILAASPRGVSGGTTLPIVVGSDNVEEAS